MNIKALTKSLKTTVTKHSPEILIGLGIAGMISTTILAVRSTPKAVKLIEEAKKEKKAELTALETVKVAWKCYIPSFVVGTASIGCIVGGNSMNLKRNAALATAYAISESAFSEYKDKVVHQIGEKKEKEIKDAIAQDHLDKNPVTNNEIIITEKGNTLCYDKLSGQYFKSDKEKIMKAENEINRQMRYDNYVSLNEFYNLLGLNESDIGNEIGWNIDSGYVEITFSSKLASDGTPCLVMDYAVAPKYDFNRYT